MAAVQYDAPPEAARITEEEVHRALAFLIAIEPGPADDTLDDLDDAAYDAVMEASPWRHATAEIVLWPIGIFCSSRRVSTVRFAPGIGRTDRVGWSDVVDE
jgi:hypothetical protein